MLFVAEEEAAVSLRQALADTLSQIRLGQEATPRPTDADLGAYQSRESSGDAREYALRVEGVYVSAPGLQKTLVEAVLRESVISYQWLMCQGDELSALYACLGGRSGVAVLAGTGSFAVGMDAAGRIETVGGWGPLLGDEGSAYAIGLAALKETCRVLDGRRQANLVSERVMSLLGAATASDFRHAVYRPEFTRTHIAALARVVSKAAAAGDDVARELLAQAGKDLAELALAVAEKLGMADSEPFLVCLTGGVRSAGKHILQAFADTLKKSVPSCTVVPPLLEPVGGAVLLALLNGGVVLSEAIVRRVAHRLAAQSDESEGEQWQK